MFREAWEATKLGSVLAAICFVWCTILAALFFVTGGSLFVRWFYVAGILVTATAFFIVLDNIEMSVHSKQKENESNAD